RDHHAALVQPDPPGDLAHARDLILDAVPSNQQRDAHLTEVSHGMLPPRFSIAKHLQARLPRAHMRSPCPIPNSRCVRFVVVLDLPAELTTALHSEPLPFLPPFGGLLDVREPARADEVLAPRLDADRLIRNFLTLHDADDDCKTRDRHH